MNGKDKNRSGTEKMGINWSSTEGMKYELELLWLYKLRKNCDWE